MRSPLAVIAALLVALSAILASPLSASESATETDRPTVLIGTGGVMWEYINPTDTPALYEFSENAEVGSLSVRAIHPATCPSEGWLTLGAGERAGDSVTDDGACRILQEPVQGDNGMLIPHWDSYVGDAEDSAYSPELGQLGDLTVGTETLAIGPGAAIALADSDGTVENYGSIDELEQKAPGNDLILIDIGAMTEREQVVFDSVQPRPTGDPLSASFTSQEWDEEEIRSQMIQLDKRLGSVLHDLEAAVPDADIVIASLSDYSSTASTLQAIMRSSEEPGLLTSSTTRRDGLVTSTDLLPSLVPESSGPGSAIVTIPGGTAADNRASAAELESLTRAIKPSTGPVYALWGLSWLAVFFLTLALRRKTFLHGAALAVASLPAASVAVNLFPWHQASEPTVVLLGTIIVISILIGLVAQYARKYGKQYPAALVASVTLVAFLGPILVGSPLALNSVFGALPQVGRFYGMTNMMFAIVGAAGLVLAGVIAKTVTDRKRAAIFIAMLGATVIFLDGSPWHGTDFGGPAVVTIGFGLLALLVLGRPITVLNAAGLIVVAGLVTAMFAIVDYLRPIEERTHLGGFVESVMDGSALTVIARKAGQVLGLWPLILILVIGFTIVFIMIRRRGISLPNPVGTDVDPWVWTSVSIAIVLVGGMLLNDSGPIIVVAGGMVAIPLIASATHYGNRGGAGVVNGDADTGARVTA